jgi:hypothetical protein
MFSKHALEENFNLTHTTALHIAYAGNVKFLI